MKNQPRLKIPKKRLDRLKQLIKSGVVYDLGHPYQIGMPHYPLHPPFAFTLSRKHGDYVYEGGVSAAADVFTTGGHVGTHLDSLGHISKDGKLHSGISASRVQDYHTGLKRLGIDQTPPILGRGVLLDIAKLKGKTVLDGDYMITANDCEKALSAQGTTLEKDDIVLIRTGWSQHWNDPDLFVSHHDGTPGPGLDAARLLSSKGIILVGSDTLAFEKMPSHLPVHEFMLVQKGIQIMEMLYLEDLSRDDVFEFAFIVSPLKIKGGTASPIRPIAIT